MRKQKRGKMKSSRWHWNTNAAHTILKGHIHWRRLLRSRCHIIYQTILQYCILYSIFPALYVPCFFLKLCAKFGFYLMPSAALALLPLNHKFLFITHKSFLIFCFFFFCCVWRPRYKRESISEKKTRTERDIEREWQSKRVREVRVPANCIMIMFIGWNCNQRRLFIAQQCCVSVCRQCVCCMCELLIYKFLCAKIFHTLEL